MTVTPGLGNRVRKIRPFPTISWIVKLHNVAEMTHYFDMLRFLHFHEIIDLEAELSVISDNFIIWLICLKIWGKLVLPFCIKGALCRI